MKLLGAKYKTFEGARKRAAFENGVALGEFLRGDKARLYSYLTQQVVGYWRVARHHDKKRQDAFERHGCVL